MLQALGEKKQETRAGSWLGAHPALRPQEPCHVPPPKARPLHAGVDGEA